MKLAAIDIGSNAIRMQISRALEQSTIPIFKKLEYIRFPLRLGHDVFTTHHINKESIQKFKKLMHAYQLLLDLYEVDRYLCCATSAMREANNSESLVHEVYQETGIKIHVINGNQEALLTNKAIRSYLSDDNYIHIDVGGGSTELNLYINGNKVTSKSFRIGSVRMIEHHDSPTVWKEMKTWIQLNTKGIQSPLKAIGTGGNISKIFEIAQKKPGRSLSIYKVKKIRDKIEHTNMTDRIYKLLMNPDRADIIVPATNIYLSVMKWAGSQKIYIPDVGLKDGMLIHLFEGSSELTLADEIK